jgi:hypothetical protein
LLGLNFIQFTVPNSGLLVLAGGTASVTTTITNTPNNSAGDPLLADLYCNGSRAVPEFPVVTNPPTVKNYQVAATSDEGNNYVSVKYGPLTVTKPSDAAGSSYKTFGDYHLAANATSANSSAVDHGTPSVSNHDVDNEARPQGTAWDIGADEVALIRLTPKALDFGKVQMGQSAPTQVVTLTNEQAVGLPITSVVVGGTNGNNFPLSANGCTGTLAANASCTFSIGFTPTATGGRVGTVTVTYTGGTQTVALTGTGASPTATVAPASIGLGSKQVNSGASAAQTVTVTNSGTGPITLNQPTFSGAPTTSGFAATLSGCTGVAAGSTCTVSVTFAPTSTGAKTATMNLTGTNGLVLTPATVAVSGTGVQGTVTFSAAGATLSGNTLAFGNLSGAVSSTVTVTVGGTAPVTFGTITVSNNGGNTNFSLATNTCTGQTVAVGGTCTITVNFNAPTGTANRTGTLTVNDNAAGTPQTLTLTGS